MTRAGVREHDNKGAGSVPGAAADFTLSPRAEALAEALSWVFTIALIYFLARVGFAAAGWKWESFQLSCLLFGVCASALFEGKRMAYLVAWAACFLTGLLVAARF